MRISEKKTYEITAFSREGKMLFVIYDGWFRNMAQIVARIRSRIVLVAPHHVYIECLDDGEYGRYEYRNGKLVRTK